MTDVIDSNENAAIKPKAARLHCGVVFTVERFVFMDFSFEVVFLLFNAAGSARPSRLSHVFLCVRQQQLARRHWTRAT
jgi:hypothetical protein